MRQVKILLQHAKGMSAWYERACPDGEEGKYVPATMSSYV